MHLRDRLAPEVAEMVYYGFWYAPKLDALLAFIREAHRHVTGEVSLNLYKGNLMVDGRSSPNSLYDEGIATMEGGGSYNQTTPKASCGSRDCPAASRHASRRASTDSSRGADEFTIRARRMGSVIGEQNREQTYWP
jgi:argininosuccinate synthase